MIRPVIRDYRTLIHIIRVRDTRAMIIVMMPVNQDRASEAKKIGLIVTIAMSVLLLVPRKKIDTVTYYILLLIVRHGFLIQVIPNSGICIPFIEIYLLL